MGILAEWAPLCQRLEEKNMASRLLMLSACFVVLGHSVAFGVSGPAMLLGSAPIIAGPGNGAHLAGTGVDIILHPFYATVQCSMKLKNGGKATDLRVILPFIEYRCVEFAGTEMDRKPNISLLGISFRGDSLSTRKRVTRKDLAHYPMLSPDWDGGYVWKIHVGKEEMETLMVKYRVADLRCSYTYDAYGKLTFSLPNSPILHGESTRVSLSVSFEGLHVSQVTDISPSTATCTSNGKLKWSFRSGSSNSRRLEIWYEVYPVPPELALYGSVASELHEPMLEALRRLDFSSFMHLFEQATYEASEALREVFGGSKGDSTEQMARSIVLNNILFDRGFEGVGSVWDAASDFERNGRWREAATLYEWWNRQFGDIVSYPRRYSLLRLYLGYCYKQMGQYDKANKLFRECLDTEPLTIARYKAVLACMFKGDLRYAEREYPWNSPNSKWLLHYCRSRGLNLFCQAGLARGH